MFVLQIREAHLLESFAKQAPYLVDLAFWRALGVCLLHLFHFGHQFLECLNLKLDKLVDQFRLLFDVELLCLHHFGKELVQKSRNDGL